MTQVYPATRSPRSDTLRALIGGALALLLVLASAPPASQAAPAGTPRERLEALPNERPDDPPGVAAKTPGAARSTGSLSFGRFTHVQVNVNGLGNDIVGDAANEPSIAVDPVNHDRMVIGWRQFGTVGSNFRQAGFGYTTDGGLTWTAGVIDPGNFRSDPVLCADADGNFYYNSLSTPGGLLRTHVYASTNGGATWGGAIFAYGGDKQWMTLDRTGGDSDGHLYQAWSTASNSYAPSTFNRSVSLETGFQAPSLIPNSPVWGTLDVASDGTLYMVGTDGPGGSTFVARSTNAQDPLVLPTFTTVSANLGGSLQTGGPNPVGLLGQLWIGVDRSGGARHGWVYVLASVETPNDPMDVHFIRSTDGGVTWSAPVRVNDDPTGNGAWQWFGTMSVAPDGRIEAVWNDSRAAGVDGTMTALYYSYSTDGGATWSANEQASPVWNSTLGWPNQQKIGDYYHMVSDVNGADLAWSSTLNNGGQDVWYLRIPREDVTGVGTTVRAASLHPVFPNPFATSTAIRFDVPAAGARVRIDVLDVRGRLVTTLTDGFRAGGRHGVRWSGADAHGRAAASGVYFCRYETGGRVETRKLMLMR